MCLGRACGDVLHGTAQQHPRTYGLHHVRLPAFWLGQGGVQLSSSTRRNLCYKPLINSFSFYYVSYFFYQSPRKRTTHTDFLTSYPLPTPITNELLFCTLFFVGGKEHTSEKPGKGILKCLDSKFNIK